MSIFPISNYIFSHFPILFNDNVIYVEIAVKLLLSAVEEKKT